MPLGRRRDRTLRSDVEVGVRDGLAYALWLPETEPAGGVEILHGAGSSKEGHFDFGRRARAMGLAVVAFDQRGHGASEGRLDDRLVDDVRSMSTLLPRGPLALRGSSMGGYVALVAAVELRPAAVVAICPAGSEHLLRGLRSLAYEFEVDRPGLERFLETHNLMRIVQRLESPLLLMHAEGDERVPIAHSQSLHRAAPMPHKRLIALPGGDHRSVQHDPELQGESLRFILKAFAAGKPAGSGVS